MQKNPNCKNVNFLSPVAIKKIPKYMQKSSFYNLLSFPLTPAKRVTLKADSSLGSFFNSCDLLHLLLEVKILSTGLSCVPFPQKPRQLTGYLRTPLHQFCSHKMVKIEANPHIKCGCCHNSQLNPQIPMQEYFPSGDSSRIWCIYCKCSTNFPYMYNLLLFFLSQSKAYLLL